MKMNKKLVTFLLLAVMILMTGGTSKAQSNAVTLEFSQWWEPELPAGKLRALVDEFQAQNPGITVKLISGPYSTTHDQTVAGAATGTMSDVVGLDGAWVNDFVKQGALADLTKLMKDAKYDPSELAAQIQLNGSTYMIPVVNFVYPVFVNLDLLKAAGIDKLPSTRTEFADAAKKIDKCRQKRLWLGAAPVNRTAQWRSERRYVVGMGQWCQYDEGW